MLTNMEGQLRQQGAEDNSTRYWLRSQEYEKTWVYTSSNATSQIVGTQGSTQCYDA